MSSRLPLVTIETILRDHLRPFRCDCHVQEGHHLTVRLYEEHEDGEELTVLGITDEQCSDTANLVRLAQELRFELYTARTGMPIAITAAEIAEL